MGSDLRTTPNTHTGMDMRTTGSGARTLTIIGFVCAAIGVFFAPIIFGVAAIVLGLVARSKGDRLGTWAAVAGVASILIGFALAAWVLSEAGEAGNAGNS
jgi:hypothetical protein